MCGRRKIDRDYPALASEYGDIDFDLLKVIEPQIPAGVIIQFHNNGEPLLYPRLGDALRLFQGKIRCLDTNGKLLLAKAKELQGNLESLTLSTFKDDPDWEEQYAILTSYLQNYGNRSPRIIIRVLGDVGEEREELYKDTGCQLAYRILHSPMGSFKYEKKTVVPEHGICLEMLGHPAINRFGKLSTCVRFDPDGKGILGDLRENTLSELWNGAKRQEWLRLHVGGERAKVALCNTCEYWGIPRG